MLHVVINIEYNLMSQFSSWNSILLYPRFYPIQLEELQIIQKTFHSIMVHEVTDPQN